MADIKSKLPPEIQPDLDEAQNAMCNFVEGMRQGLIIPMLRDDVRNATKLLNQKVKEISAKVDSVGEPEIIRAVDVYPDLPNASRYPDLITLPTDPNTVAMTFANPEGPRLLEELEEIEKKEKEGQAKKRKTTTKRKAEKGEKGEKKKRKPKVPKLTLTVPPLSTAVVTEVPPTPQMEVEDFLNRELNNYVFGQSQYQ